MRSLGRRPSVERTTVRRFRPARKRPGAGELPALASGRERARFGDGTVMLLRRAPREVYRVYGHDDFLADAIAHRDEPSKTRPPEARERRLQRIAGTTMLLTAVGAVGGVIATMSLPRAVVRHSRGVPHLRAVGTPHVPARSDVWQAPALAGVPQSEDARDQPAGIARRGPRAIVHARRFAAAPGHRGVASDVAPPARVGAPTSVSAPAGAAGLTASASPVQRPPGQVEFGFER